MGSDSTRRDAPKLPFPDATRYAQIPVRIVFSEKNGFVPLEIALTLTVIGH